MNQKDIRDRLWSLLLSQTQRQESEADFSLLLREDFGLESFLLVNLLGLVEEEFSLEIDEEEFFGIRTAGDLVELVTELCKIRETEEINNEGL